MLLRERLQRIKLKKHRQHIKLFKKFLRSNDIASEYYTYMMCIGNIKSVDRYLMRNSVLSFFPDLKGHHETIESIYSFQIMWTYMDTIWLQYLRYNDL